MKTLKVTLLRPKSASGERVETASKPEAQPNNSQGWKINVEGQAMFKGTE
ncbi:hypothetical protein [Klebsiella pneumoniae]